MSDELFPKYKHGLDKQWCEAFDTLVGRGKSPSGARAAIEYATTIKTQQQVADEYDVAVHTIRAQKDEVIEVAPVDESQLANYSWDETTKKDYADEIADELGWTIGEQYRVEPYTPILSRKGWRELHEKIILTHSSDDE